MSEERRTPNSSCAYGNSEESSDTLVSTIVVKQPAQEKQNCRAALEDVWDSDRPPVGQPAGVSQTAFPLYISRKRRGRGSMVVDRRREPKRYACVKRI